MKSLKLFPILPALASCATRGHVLPPAENEIPARKTKLTAEQIQNLRPLNIAYQLRGLCWAYSSANNAIPSNGEYQSENLPVRVTDDFPKGKCYLAVNPHEQTVFDSGVLGCTLYFVNTTDSALRIEASDSQLPVIAEAQDRTGRWRPISYLPSSWCGNSYHTVVLDSGEYWTFSVPVFDGPFRTRLRYTFAPAGGPPLHSAELPVSLNKAQFEKARKQGHSPNGIMDPYDE